MYHRHFAEGVKVVQHIRSAKIEIVGLKPQFHISGTAVELPPVQKHYRMPKSFLKHVYSITLQNSDSFVESFSIFFCSDVQS